MAEDKQQTLTQLYSLRAGISAVATQRNKVEKINRQREKDIKEVNDRIRELECEENKKIFEKINKLNDEKNNLQSHIYTLNREIKENQDYVDKNKYIREPVKKSNLGAIFSALSVLIIPVVAVAYILLYIFVIGPNVESGVINFILYITVLISGFIGLCSLGAFFSILFSDMPKEIEKNKEDYKKRLSEYYDIRTNIKNSLTVIEENQCNVSALQSKISYKDRSIAEVENEKEFFTKKIRDCQIKILRIKNAAEKACIPHYQLGALIQEQFENQFNSFLNLRDWEDLDVIIFAYESGRVETMKEALAYADEETRTDRIVDAINDSTQAVCRSIQTGLYNLAKSMGECFSVISRQIAEQTNKLDKISVSLENLSDNMESLSVNTANLSASIAENTASNAENLANLAARVDYSNALQEQRNKSSAELVEKNETFMLEARNYMHDLYINKY